ncbi:MAG: PqqD family protein [Deltaproteobacteria bacterium]|nr:PqqD family protein [Deltaproteobacteria bacterium]
MFDKSAVFKIKSDFSVDADGDVLIKYRTIRKSFFDRIMTPPERKIQLDEIGSATWKLIQEGKNWDEISRELISEFPKEQNMINRTRLFLEKLCSMGILVISKS